MVDPEQEVVVRPYQAADEAGVLALWRRCELTRPWNDPQKDILRKQQVQQELFLVGTRGGQVIATVMAGYEGHRGWINYLAVDPDHQRRGYGGLLMDAAERGLRELGCPKINLQVRSTNAAVLEFYRRAGYVVDDVVSLGKRLERDD